LFFSISLQLLLWQQEEVESVPCHYIWFSLLKYRPVAQATLRGKCSACCSRN